MSRVRIVLTLLLLACLLPSVALGDTVLTISVAPQVEPFTQPLTVSGSLSDSSGAALSGTQLDLQASSNINATNFATVATTAAGADGSYSFTLTPAHNGRYRVVEAKAPSVVSTTVPVYRRVVWTTGCNWCRPGPLPTGAFSIVFHYRIQSPVDVHLGGKQLILYVGRNADRTLHIVARSRVRQLRAGVAAGRAVARVAAGTTSFGLDFCMRLAVSDRIGGPGTTAPCPKTLAR